MGDTAALRREVQRVKNRFAALGRAPTKAWLDAGRADQLLLRSRYLETLLSEDWATLAARAAQDVADAERRWPVLVARQQRAAQALDGWAAVEAAAGPWLMPARRPDWPEVQAALVDELRRQGRQPAEIEARLALLQRLDLPLVGQQVQRAAATTHEHLDLLAWRQLGTLAGATLALAVARFNLAMAATPRPAMPSPAALQRLAARADALAHETWQALAARDLARAHATAQDLAASAAHALAETLPAATAALALRRRGRPADAALGARALQAGRLARQCWFALVFGRWVGWLAGWPPVAPVTARWLRAARTRTMGVPADEVPLRLCDLLAADADRSAVIEGVLGPVTIQHRGRKAISTASVADAQGQRVAVVLPHIKLDSGGLVPGAWVRLSGTWRMASKEAGGPALELARRNLGREARTDARAWARLALHGLAQPVPHSLAAEWSWEPGADGAGNPLRYGLWFVAEGERP